MPYCFNNELTLTDFSGNRLKMFREIFLHADVLCIESYSDLVLAGVGGCLLLYKNGKLQGRKKIFEGERVHQIYVTQDKIFVKGGKELTEIIVQANDTKISCDIRTKIKCSDWIQDVLILKDDLIIATAHNIIEIWSLMSGDCKKKYVCEEKCILYSCKIIGIHLQDLIVLAGTVFSEVVIWNPVLNSDAESKVLHRLKGHNGVIFSIQIDLNRKLISTTSDDRTLRLWSISTHNDLLKRSGWKSADISLLLTVFGHTARVWKSLILKSHFVSAGEDSKLCLWDENGKLEKNILLHQSSGIRGLCYNNSSKSVLTGGEDGGIVEISHNHLLKNHVPFKLDTHENHIPHRVAFTENEIIISTDRGSILASENNEKIKILYEDKEFTNYCLLEVSKCKSYVALASLKGRLVVLNIKTKSVVFDKIIIKGKIFSIHFLEEYFITCGVNGDLKIWKINWPHLNNVKNYILPNSKERWTTCALVKENKFLIGDRMGNFYFFKDGENPVRSFMKIHGYLGVTDIISNRDVIFTSGRDGTVKEFTLKDDLLEYSLSYKLPMEWIWRIVDFGNDKLILGFSSVYLIVWSLSDREILIKFNCGGGHRSCDYKISNDNLQFVYIKEKNVYSITFALYHLNRLRNGFHAKEINCMRIIPRKSLIVSGSEDTTLRISKLENDDIKNVYVLENHISSVRAVSIYNLSEVEKVIVAAGGRAQISLWKLNVDDLTCKEIETTRLNEGNNSRNAEPSFDPETRFMCLDCFKISDTKFLIATGCSDRMMRIFSYEINLILEEAIPYSHCILNITFLKVRDNCLVASFATDGKIVFWEINENVKARKLKSVEMHQSGINSFAIKDLGSDLFLLATGGDDNLLAISIFKFNSKGNIDVLNCWKNTTTHSCQITGILLIDEYMLTTSIDQRLTVWRYQIKENDISTDFIAQYLTPVPDIQGMEIYNIAQGSVSVCVYGKGIEIVNVKLK